MACKEIQLELEANQFILLGVKGGRISIIDVFDSSVDDEVLAEIVEGYSDCMLIKGTERSEAR